MFELYLRPRWCLALATTFMFGLATLTKGTPVAALLLVPGIVFLAAERRARVLTDYRLWLLLLAGIVIGLSWHLFLFFARPDVREAIINVALLPFGIQVDKSIGARHYEAPWFYLLETWRIAVPASFFLPVALYVLPKSRLWRNEKALKFLCVVVVSALVVFSLTPQKQEHYLLPLMPALALVVARALVLFSEQHFRHRWLFYIPLVSQALVVVGLALVAGFSLRVMDDQHVVIASFIALIIAAAAIVSVVLARRGRVLAVAASTVAAWALIHLVLRAVIDPVQDQFAHGVIYSDPSYNAASWNAKFEKYPFLRETLKVDDGLEKLREREEESLGLQNLDTTSTQKQ